MEKVLRLYKYIDGINDIAFPNEKEQAIITSFRYDAKRMGAAPTISFSLMHSLCLDSLWDNKVYALFNGERFYVKQTPTSSYSSSDTRYKHEVELVSERFIIDNIYFYDVVSSSSQDKPVSNSSKFSFFGNIEEYVSRLNNSLNKSNVGYSIVIDDDILSDEALVSIESQVTFEDQVITNALQEIYNVYKIPYYFVGKTIHVGYYQDNIDTVFKYGCDNSLISISKTNANSKVINKITGIGSSDNIPYYYPNVDEKGITQVLCNGREGIAKIIDLAKYRKVKLADKFVFHKTIQSLVPLIDEDDYSFGDFHDEGIDGDGKQRVSIDFYYSFTLQQYESVELSVTTTYEDSLDLIYEIFNPSGQYVGYYKEDKTMQLTGGYYQFVIRWSFLSKEPMIGSDDVIKNFVSQYLKVKANIVVDSSNAWTKNNIPVALSDYGISVNSPSDGDVLTIERLAYIQPQPNLVPPIYRNTEGGERFYEAINGEYKNENGEYYQFDNEYTTTNPREHIENFDDIKPTIKNVINGSGDYIDEFIDFAYDLNDNDETDESGKFIHPYFFGKLRRFDGEFGFNLFDHAIDEGEMVVSMTSGTCGSCEFVIGVDEQSQKNKVQVDSDGNLVRDNNGNVRLSTPQDRQNDTKNNEVWIALKKDIQTFGVVMPNVGKNYRPKAKDKFVLLHIDLPQKYVEAAENALKDKLIKYMHENNFEKFNFSIAFSRIYFAENPTILANLSENSKIKIEYNKNIYDLYVSSLSYSISNDSALPEVKVELEDALAISQNQITQVVESTKREIISSIDKDVFWGDIKGVPTWITSDKPRYSYSELSGRGTSNNSNDVWVVKKDAKGNSYVYTKLDVVVERGVTMYGTDGSVDVPSIFEGLLIDNDTIYWEEIKDKEGNVTKILKSKGGEGGGLGFVVLMDGDVLSDKLVSENTIYEVRGIFNLQRGTINIPYNSVLFFNGGGFTNGTIQGNNTGIGGVRNYNYFDNCTLRGFNTGFFDVRWFGGVPDYDTASNSGTDNAIFFDRAIKACGLNTGAYIRVIGKYLIGSTITVKHDLVMQGDYHPNRTFRAESGVEEEGCNSLIFVKSGVTAFLVVGRGDSGMRSSHLFINNIKFVGGAIGSSVLIEYTATGAPTRVGKFAECVCTNFRRVLYFHDKDGGSEGTIYGNLTIEKVFAYYNNQFIVATVSAATVASRPSFMSLCNLMIKDSTIEQNGSNAIYLERLFGPTVINNCLLEATPNAIYATVIAGSLEITNNYFEQQGGSYMIHVEGMNVNNCFFTYTGNYRVNADKGKKFEISGFTVVDFNTSGYQRSDVKFEGCIVEKNLWRKVNVSGIGSHSRFTDIKYYKVYPYDDFAFPMSFGAKKLKGGMLGLIGHKGTKSRVARTWCPVVSGDNLLLCYYYDGASQHEVYLCNDSGAVIANEKPVLYGGAEGIQFFKFTINSATSYINVYMDCSNPICIGNGFIFKNVPDDMCLDELGIMYPNDLSGDSNVAYKNAEGLRGMTYVSEGVYDGLYYSDGSNIRNGDGSIFTKVKVITKYVDGWTFTDTNTVYRIAGDLALGKEVTMPSGCTLDFSLGGKISTGKLRLTSTKILPYGLNTSHYATNGFTGSYAEGQVIYNSASKRMELYNGSSWVKLDGSSF